MIFFNKKSQNVEKSQKKKKDTIYKEIFIFPTRTLNPFSFVMLGISDLTKIASPPSFKIQGGPLSVTHRHYKKSWVLYRIGNV